VPHPIDPSADLDLRLVRYFTAVAGHRHFGRAAAELRVAQPSLSRQIRQLEAQLGARLLDRDRHGTRLTEAGEVFLPRAEALLRSAAQAAVATRSAARPARIVIGYTAGIVVTPAVRNLRHSLPGADIHTRHLAWNEPRQALLGQEVDVAVTRLPLRTEGLEVAELYQEPRVLMVSAGHRLAGKEAVSLDDISDEPMPRFPDPEWNAFWRVDPRPDGSAAPGGPPADSIEDKLEFIAAGEAVAIVPGIPRAAGTRGDVVTVALADVEPAHVVLVSRASDSNRLLEAFRAAAVKCLTGPA
jgi:DNA-binding transcriptional LysR family regulator